MTDAKKILHLDMDPQLYAALLMAYQLGKTLVDLDLVLIYKVYYYLLHHLKKDDKLYYYKTIQGGIQVL